MRYILLFASVLVLNAAQAFQADSLLTVTLKESGKALSFEGKNITGSGAEFLINSAKASHFFLIGEEHGIAEIPKFTAALFRGIIPVGYKNYATEVGPFTADHLVDITAKNDAQAALKKEFQTHNWSIPFFAWREEAEVIEVLKEQVGLNEKNLWGLDQEFIISARILLNKLVKMAPNANARKLAKEYYDNSMASFAKAVETKVPMVFLSTATSEDYQKLRTAFKRAPEAIELLNEMEESQDIYGKFNTGQGFESNQQRADMMKRHFLQYYRNSPDKDETRVMVKLGANHVYKGYNGLGAMDIGNFVNDFAFSKGQQSFHLLVAGGKGTQNGYNLMSKSEDDKARPMDNSQNPMGKNFIEAMGDSEMMVFDLRPLRAMLFNRKLRGLDENLVKLIYSYDAVLIIANVNASTNYDE